MISFRRSEGWTLIELISVLVIVGILATMMLNSLRFGIESARSDATQERINVLRRAILGSDFGSTSEGGRSNFGFVGDVGRLPTALSELAGAGALPAYTYNTYWGVGAGWRGPYLSTGDNKGIPFDEDLWSHAFTYATVGTAVIRSLGFDNAVGGTADNTDLEALMPPSIWMSTVTGMARDANVILSGATVSFAYPVAGVLTTYNTTADANGYFVFNTVPFGYRSVRVQSAEGVASVPTQVTIDRHPMVLGEAAGNSLGGLQAVTVETGSVKAYSSGTNIVVTLKNSYLVDLQLRSITVTWTGGGTYSIVVMNGVSETLSAPAASGAATTINATMMIVANSINNSLELQFSTSKSGVALTVVLAWFGQAKTDTLTFTPP